METIKKTQLGAETRVLNRLYKKFGRVTVRMQEILEKRGYTLCELGTGTRSYTFSGDVGKKYFANDNEIYFGIGICNISKKQRNSGFSYVIYRAYVKKLEK